MGTGGSHGYSDCLSILHVVHHPQRRVAHSLVPGLRICPRMGIPNAEQVVSHAARRIQRRDLLVYRNVQDIRAGV